MGSSCQSSAPVTGEPEGRRDTEMADEVDWLDLPGRWTYGVDRGGRVFFIKYVVCVLSFIFSLELSNLKGGTAGGWLPGVGRSRAGTAGMTNKFIGMPV